MRLHSISLRFILILFFHQRLSLSLVFRCFSNKMSSFISFIYGERQIVIRRVNKVIQLPGLCRPVSSLEQTEAYLDRRHFGESVNQPAACSFNDMAMYCVVIALSFDILLGNSPDGVPFMYSRRVTCSNSPVTPCWVNYFLIS
jgi:hypothetical protein